MTSVRLYDLLQKERAFDERATLAIGKPALQHQCPGRIPGYLEAIRLIHSNLPSALVQTQDTRLCIYPKSRAYELRVDRLLAGALPAIARLQDIGHHQSSGTLLTSMLRQDQPCFANQRIHQHLLADGFDRFVIIGKIVTLVVGLWHQKTLHGRSATKAAELMLSAGVGNYQKHDLLELPHPVHLHQRVPLSLSVEVHSSTSVLSILDQRQSSLSCSPGKLDTQRPIAATILR